MGNLFIDLERLELFKSWVSGTIIKNLFIDTPPTCSENYFTIMSIISGLYIGLLAFMYPRVVDFKRDMQDKFIVLYQDFSSHNIQKYYLCSISSLLIFALFCIFMSIIDSKAYCLGINIVFAVSAIILNYFLAVTVEKYLFSPDVVYKKLLSTIDFNEDLNEQDIRDEYIKKIDSIQTVTLFFINKDILQFDQIKKYISYLTSQIQEYIEYQSIPENNRDASDSANNLYYGYPLERLLYISHVAIERNKLEIVGVIISDFVNLLEMRYQKSKRPFDFMLSGIVVGVINILKYSIKRGHDQLQYYQLLEIMIRICYPKLIQLFSFNESLINLRPQLFLFMIYKEMIPSGADLLYLRYQLELIYSFGLTFYFNNDKELWNKSKACIRMSTFDLLAYLYYLKKYRDIRDYIGKNKYCFLPHDMTDLVKCICLKDNSIFSESFTQEYEGDIQDRKYKYYIVFLVLCLIKQTVGNKSIQRSVLREYKLQSLPSVDSVSLYMDEFLLNKELLELFKLSDESNTYKEFISDKINEINSFVNERNSALDKILEL